VFPDSLSGSVSLWQEKFLDALDFLRFFSFLDYISSSIRTVKYQILKKQRELDAIEK